jgi:RNA recognition motif-containing protein
MNIFVSKLSYAINDADLKDLFEEYGPVSSAKVITDKMTGRSRGFGFVEIEDETMGQKAIEELNECEYDGRVISVSIAKPKTEHSGERFGNQGRNGNNYNSSRNARY